MAVGGLYVLLLGGLTVEILDRRCVRLERITRSYVFTTRIGTPQREDNLLSRSLKPLMREAGLPEYNFQTLRRSNATFLVLLNIHPRTAMRWLGHGDVSTTMKIYQQAPDELQERAADLMGELLFGPRTDENGL